MSQFKLILRSLLFYWRKNLVLALGVAVSTAVITGSLVVGDSVKSSLENQVDLRLGKTTHVLTAADRFFTENLAAEIEVEKDIPTAPILMLRGIAVVDGGKVRVPGVQILGVNSEMDHFAGQSDYYKQLGKNEVVVSENLAQKLGVTINDQLLFRIRKASLIPLNAPFVSDEETSVAVRVKVKSIAGDDELGRFDLSNSQTSPMNAFFNLDYLNDIMDLDKRANLILLESENSSDIMDVNSFIGGLFKLADYGLDLHFLNHQEKWELSSERVFMEDKLKELAQSGLDNSETVFTYFVNSLISGDRSSPYSFVASSDAWSLKDNEIMINSWLSEDLAAGKGDTINLEYFDIGPLRELEEKTSSFVISDVFNMDSPLADSSLMPFLPGLSDAGDCSDWETGIPIDLDRIRDKDEDYWDAYKGSPKAVISINTSSKLWSNRFGKCTAIRYSGSPEDGARIKGTILNSISPQDLGFLITESKLEGKNAASNGTDFGQLFLGLSFFLLLAGIVLTIVLFMLSIENRREQLGTFTILGFSNSRIRSITFIEGVFAAFFGLLLGMLLTVFYNKLIFSALNSIWVDVVRTDVLQLYFKPLTLFLGALISLVVVSASLYISLSRFLKRRVIDLHRRTFRKRSKGFLKAKTFTKWITMLGGIALIIWQLVQKESEQAGIFFLAGGLLLVSFVLIADGVLGFNRSYSIGNFNLTSLSIKNRIQNRGRSLAIVILFALGVFLVVTTGANHKDPYSNSGKKTSGTGGFQFFAQTTVPVLHNLNNEDVRFDYGIEGDYDFVHFRRMNGDDASCLNLNKIQKPAILGLRTKDLEGRFNFVSKTDDLYEDSAWESLNQDLQGGLIPAIADQTVIQWGLGKKVGDTLLYQDELGQEMRLLLIGGLGNSVFQGHVIISDKQFLNHFPSSSGSSLFLIDNIEDTEEARQELERGFRDFGWDMESGAEKLAEFNSIENTYLSIFMILGALGLLLGTVGLGILLVRNLQERRKELGMLKALGYSNKLILKVVFYEYVGLLSYGLLAGGLSAIIAVLPGLIKPYSEVSIGFLLLIVGIILLNGILWIWILAKSYLRKPNLISALRDE